MLRKKVDELEEELEQMKFYLAAREVERDYVYVSQ